MLVTLSLALSTLLLEESGCNFSLAWSGKDLRTLSDMLSFSLSGVLEKKVDMCVCVCVCDFGSECGLEEKRIHGAAAAAVPACLYALDTHHQVFRWLRQDPVALTHARTRTATVGVWGNLLADYAEHIQRHHCPSPPCAPT